MEYETEILIKLWFMKMRVSEDQRPLSELPRKLCIGVCIGVLLLKEATTKALGIMLV